MSESENTPQNNTGSEPDTPDNSLNHASGAWGVSSEENTSGVEDMIAEGSPPHDENVAPENDDNTDESSNTDTQETPIVTDQAVNINPSENLQNDNQEPVAEDQQQETAESQQYYATPNTYTQSENNTETPHKTKKKKSGAMAAIATGTFGVGLLIGLAVPMIATQNQTTVPKAVQEINFNSDEEKACKTFEDNDLKCNLVFKKEDNKEKGELISQSVKEGDKVAKDSTIDLVYSEGPKTSKMPKIKNKAFDDVKKDLYKQGITIDTLKAKDNTGKEKGIVVDSSVKPGKKLSNGDSIEITVSSGENIAEDYVGKNYSNVYKKLDDLGVKVKKKEATGNAPYGVVTKQSVKEGDEFKNNELELTVTVPSEEFAINVPNVENMSESSALEELYSKGLTNLDVVYVESTNVDESTVVNVTPGAGSTTTSNQTVIVIVAYPSA